MKDNDPTSSLRLQMHSNKCKQLSNNRAVPLAEAYDTVADVGRWTQQKNLSSNIFRTDARNDWTSCEKAVYLEVL